MSFKQVLIILSLILGSASIVAQAAWQEDGYVPDPSAGRQLGMRAIEDDQGGMIYTWVDDRSGRNHIYAQRIDGSGESLWQSGGLPICTYAASDHQNPVIVPDGSGGAFIAWITETDAVTNDRVVAQHVDEFGNVSWPVDGYFVTTGLTGRASQLQITATDDGAAIMVWINTDPGSQVHAQRLSVTGPEWAGSAIVCDETSGVYAPKAVSMAGGGAIFVWQDGRVTPDVDLWTAALDSDGDLAWTERAVCDHTGGYRDHFELLSDGLGGAFVSWTDTRDAAVNIYIERILPDGTRFNPGEGALVEAGSGSKLAAAANGCYVAFKAYDGSDTTLKLQRFDWSLNTGWSYSREFMAGYGSRSISGLIPDGTGGVLALARDSRYDTDGDIFAQRISEDGYSRWESEGLPVRISLGWEIAARPVSDGAGGMLLVWWEDDTGQDLHVQRLEHNSYWGYPSAEIAAVQDIAADQGGTVHLSWDASRLDTYLDQDVYRYSLWRAPTDGGNKQAPQITDDWAECIIRKKIDGPIYRADSNGAKTVYWELVDHLEAAFRSGYSQTVATLGDSSALDPAQLLFQVVTHGHQSTEIWYSEAIAGHSVDNLAPGAPVGLTGTGQYQPVGIRLEWQPRTEADLNYYQVHRGLSAEFTPDGANLVATPVDTTAFDGDWNHDVGWYYKVAAVDVHGNIGNFATLEPDIVSGVGDNLPPKATTLVGNYPNPFNPQTTVEYELADDVHVKLRVYDVAGRLVQTLVDMEQPMGRHEVIWDGLDVSGRQAASGVYLVRLVAGVFHDVQRLTLVK